MADTGAAAAAGVSKPQAQSKHSTATAAAAAAAFSVAMPLADGEAGGQTSGKKSTPVASPRTPKGSDPRSPNSSISDFDEGGSTTGRGRRRRGGDGQGGGIAGQKGIGPIGKEEAKKVLDAAMGAMKSAVRVVRKSPRDNVVTSTYSNVADKYAMHKDELGSGQYGVIRKCIDIKTGRVYACKTIDKENIKVSGNVKGSDNDHRVDPTNCSHYNLVHPKTPEAR